MRISNFWIGLGAIAFNFASYPAYAIQIYVDASAGFNRILKGATYFDTGSTETPTGGAGINLAVLYRVNPFNVRLPIHIGLQHRMSTGTLSTESVGVQALYPIVRAQLQRIYISVGATPLVWNKVGGSSGLALYSKKSVGTFAGVAEAGYEFPITPEISLAGGVATQYARTASVADATYMTFEYFGMFRFYFGTPPDFDARDQDRDNDRDKYRGYRYPYGVPR